MIVVHIAPTGDYDCDYYGDKILDEVIVANVAPTGKTLIVHRDVEYYPPPLFTNNTRRQDSETFLTNNHD